MDFSQALLLQWFDDISKKISKYKKIAIAGVVSIAILTSFIVGYVFYKNKIRAEAYKDFLAAMQYYDGVVKTKKDNSKHDFGIKYFSNENEKWQQTEHIFKQKYQKYQNIEFAPIFLAFQTEALLKLGKTDEAIKQLNEVINQLKSNEIKDYYRIKLALVKMDKADEKVKQEGLTELINIANNENSMANDIALYQVGNYFWNQKNYIETKNYWRRFLIKTTTKMGQPSIFANEVKEKLGLITT